MCGTSVQLSGQPSVEQAAHVQAIGTVEGGPASSAVCVHASSRHAHMAAALSSLCAASSICRDGSLEREREVATVLVDSARTKTHGRATVACQKGGMYPTFDSAAGSGEIPVFFGI